jgi:NAD-dependent dihydropyrimidine dehydrogenase PreA subunit
MHLLIYLYSSRNLTIENQFIKAERSKNMSRKWYLVIDYVACAECGSCVDMCQHGVYDKKKSTNTGCRFSGRMHSVLSWLREPLSDERY